jgi:hypothetical protein
MSSQSSGLAHATEPPLTNDASKREGGDLSQRSAPSQSTGNRLLVASSALEVLNDDSDDSRSYDPAQHMPASGLLVVDDDEYSEQMPCEEGLNDIRGGRYIAQNTRDNTAPPGSQANAIRSSEPEDGRSSPGLIVMSNSSAGTDSSEVATQAEAALDSDRQQIAAIRSQLSGDSDEKQMAAIRAQLSGDLDEKQMASIRSQLSGSSSADSDEKRMASIRSQLSGDSDEKQMASIRSQLSGDSDEKQMASIRSQLSGDSDEKQMAVIRSQSPVGTDPDSSSSHAEQAMLQTAAKEEPTAANRNSEQIAIGTTFDDSDSSEGSDLVALAEAALAQWDASSSDSDSSSSEIIPPSSQVTPVGSAAIGEGKNTQEPVSTDYDVASGVAMRESIEDASEASTDTYQEPVRRDNDVAAGVVAGATAGVAAGVMVNESAKYPSEASAELYQELAASDYHDAAGVTVKEDAAREASEETNIKTTGQLQAEDAADGGGESDSGSYDPYQSTPQIAAIGVPVVGVAAVGATADDSAHLEDPTADDSAHLEDSPDSRRRREEKGAAAALAAGTVVLAVAAIADDSSSATVADRYDSSSTGIARSAGDDTKLAVSSFDGDFNDDSDGSSYDITKFMPDSELEESSDQGESTEQLLSEEEELVESERNSRRAAQVSAAQAGLQAALLARQDQAVLDPIDYDDQVGRVSSVDPTSKSQSQAASLANDMTTNSKLFQAQKEREEAMANPTSVPDIEEGIPTSKERDRSMPKPNPKTKAAPINTKRKKCAFLILALLLVVGAIVAVLGTTLGWFKSSSSKSSGENPTVSPTVVETSVGPNSDLVPRPTVGPTTLDLTPRPTSRAPTVGPTTMDLGSRPTLGPITFGPTTLVLTPRPTFRTPTVGPSTMDLGSRPSAGPTTLRPTLGPTMRPTPGPTSRPSLGPTLAPTLEPTLAPTLEPTLAPTLGSTTSGPTQGLALVPSLRPTTSPTIFVVPQDLLDLVSAVSFDGGASAQLEGTPQNRGVKWLGSSAVYDTLSDQQKIQRYCLAVFYYSTNGDRWTNNGGWLSDENECTWFTRALRGEACDSNGLFIGLRLSFNRLGGELPPEIGLLTGLEAVSIGGGFGGSVDGILPSYLGLLTQMQFFNVRDNDFSGTIPPELGAWTDLDVLNLSRNQFSGPIPTSVGQMTALTRLDLSSNRLRGGVPNELSALNILEDVRLEDNDLTGAVPISVCTLFISTAPLFYTDCGNPPGVGSEIGCFCCTHCCSDEQGCVSVFGA